MERAAYSVCGRGRARQTRVAVAPDKHEVCRGFMLIRTHSSLLLPLHFSVFALYSYSTSSLLCLCSLLLLLLASFPYLTLKLWKYFLPLVSYVAVSCSLLFFNIFARFAWAFVGSTVCLCFLRASFFELIFIIYIVACWHCALSCRNFVFLSFSVSLPLSCNLFKRFLVKSYFNGRQSTESCGIINCLSKA